MNIGRQCDLAIRFAIFNLQVVEEIDIPMRRRSFRNLKVIRHSQCVPSPNTRMGRHARIGLHTFEFVRGMRIGCESIRRDKPSCRGNHGQESHLEYVLCTHNAPRVLVRRKSTTLLTERITP